MARSKVFDEESVLSKAVDLFWCKGYQGTSAQDLVDGLGISRSSLYDTYGDKRTLYIKTLQKYRTETVSKVIAFISDSKDIHKTLRDFFNLTVKDSIEDPTGKGCYMLNSTVEIDPNDIELLEIIQQNAKSLEDVFCDAIEKGQLNDQIKSQQNARVLARFLLNSISGIRVTAKSQKDPKALEDIMNMTLSVLD